MAPIKSNSPFASYFDFFSKTGKDAVSPYVVPPTGLTATGGTINDYEISGTHYRAHTFTSSGALNVTALSNSPDFPDTVEYLVVAGGGGGGARGGGNAGGGAGAGGLRTNLTGHPLAGAAFPVAVSPYTVVIGAGGGGSTDGPGSGVSNGVNSVFGSIISTGGGHGGGHHTPPAPASFAKPGGSGGGGGGATPYAGGAGNTPPVSPSQGNAGGPGFNGNPYVGGGGGGAGAVSYTHLTLPTILLV